MKRVNLPTAYMFDVDGVITEPFSKRIDPTIISFIADKLNASVPISVYTGRSFDFVDRHVIELLKRSISSPLKLDLLCISSEVGMHNITFNNGKTVETVDETYRVPKVLRSRITDVLEDYPMSF